MRFDVLWRPSVLFSKATCYLNRRARLASLKGTPAEDLLPGHIDSLELLRYVGRAGDISVVYDVGANVGTWTMLAKACLPDAQVHAFEPLKSHSDVFRATAGRLERVTLHEVALGNERGERPLIVTSFSDASSFLELDTASLELFGLTVAKTENVPIRRLDELILEESLNLPDLLKLDVQGFELQVLGGATETLKSVRYVITEVSFDSFYQKQAMFHDVVGFLAANGLFVRAFAATTILGAPVHQTDVLFERMGGNRG